MRRLGTTALLMLSPAAALAEGTMPQMDFHNPLTGSQVVWMVVILVVLYFALSRWALPGVGKVLENRSAVILRDLSAARGAKTEADEAVAALHATIAQARQKAQAEVAEMLGQAKAAAAAKAAAQAERLEQDLAASEQRIATARAAAMAAIKPVAEQTAGSIVLKMTGKPVGAETLSEQVDAALAARKAA
jgi:F-type H+-transporting ATPase subunit b